MCSMKVYRLTMTAVRTLRLVTFCVRSHAGLLVLVLVVSVALLQTASVPRLHGAAQLELPTKDTIDPLPPPSTPGSDPERQGSVGESGAVTFNSSHLNILLWTNSSMTRRVLATAKQTLCRLEDGKTCQVLFDRAAYNQSEAVVFQLQPLKEASDYPQYRLPFHKWIHVEDEAPPQATRFWPGLDVLRRIKHKFNMTSNFHSSSTLRMARYDYDVTMDAGKLQKRQRMHADHQANKTRNVAWFVSHCPTQSRREDYVRELQKYIDVDVYGLCGNLSCGDMPTGQFGACDMSVLDAKYRFYLSFENGLCEGYVTEKLWRFLYKPVRTIPVVMGLMNYSRFMPPRTLIDVRDYSSPRHLADYLKYVAGNPGVFNEYIDRRLSLSFRHQPEFEELYQRRLCRFLHQHRKDVMMVSDIVEAWSVEKRCVRPSDYLPGDFWTQQQH